MQKVIIFGAGRNFSKMNHFFFNKYEIIAIVDNDEEKHGLMIDGVAVVSPLAIDKYAYDLIYITVTGCHFHNEIIAQLTKQGIDGKKIKTLIDDEEAMGVLININPYDETTDVRVNWLREYALYVNNKKILGSVAECGVFRGHFARYINKYFPDRKLYLFDTFEGFDEGDLDKESSFGSDSFAKSDFAIVKGIFKDTDERYVFSSMPNRENVIVKKGLFPDTAIGVDDLFCFVNLDMDLYQPTLSGLCFFWPKMSEGGVILLHDYFHNALPGVSKAVEDFESELGRTLAKVPIGDFCSIALIKGEAEFKGV